MTDYDYYVSEMKTINEHYEEEYGSRYVHDGVINPHVMFDNPSRPHIIYLMKECVKSSNNWEPCSEIENEFRFFPSKTNSSRCWGANICRPIKYLTEGKYWDKVPREQKDKYFADGFAYINVKKVQGNPKSNDDDLDIYSCQDGEWLKKQIICSKPDIVFCCEENEKQILRLDGIMGEERTEISSCSCNFAWYLPYHYGKRDNKLIAIRWIHPSQGAVPKIELKERMDFIIPFLKEVHKNNSLGDQISPSLS